MRYLSLLAAFAILTLNPLPQEAQGQSPSADDLRSEEWREDLQYFVEQMAQVHVDLYHTITPERFQQAVSALRDRVPRLADHEVIVELARIVTMIGDGHTGLWLTPNHGNRFHQYPVLLYWLKDGLYVLAAEERYADVVGGRVVRIGNVSADEAMARVAELVHRDNTMGVLSIAPRYLAIPEVLHALRVSEHIDRAEYLVRRADGREVAIELAAIPDSDLSNLSNRPYVLPSEQDRVRLTFASDGRPTPLWLSDPGNRFWHRYLEDSRTLYVQLNAIGNKREESMSDFFERVFREVDEREPERLVIDLRLNGGGNNMLNLPIVHGILKRDAINQYGRLYVIVGRHTFSAASHLVTYLERHANALFVGEPTGGSPNHYGDAAPVILPNSGLRIGASTIYWQNSLPRPFETRDSTSPDIAAELTIDAYREGRDPALEAILSYPYRRSLTELMVATLERDGIAVAEAVFREFMNDPRHVYADNESEINRLGYRLLEEGDTEAAVAVFQLNVETYPSSANVHDSLGDAYLAQGDTASAIQSYTRAVEVDPEFGPSQRNLARLRRR